MRTHAPKTHVCAMGTHVVVGYVAYVTQSWVLTCKFPIRSVVASSSFFFSSSSCKAIFSLSSSSASFFSFSLAIV